MYHVVIRLPCISLRSPVSHLCRIPPLSVAVIRSEGVNYRDLMNGLLDAALVLHPLVVNACVMIMTLIIMKMFTTIRKNMESMLLRHVPDSVVPVPASVLLASLLELTRVRHPEVAAKQSSGLKTPRKLVAKAMVTLYMSGIIGTYRRP